jgi:hypothetical protein
MWFGFFNPTFLKSLDLLNLKALFTLLHTKTSQPISY